MENGLNCPNRRGIYGPIVTEECDHRPKECSKVSSNLELSHDYKELLPTTRCEYEERPDRGECLPPPQMLFQGINCCLDLCCPNQWIWIDLTNSAFLQITTNIDNMLDSLDVGVPWQVFKRFTFCWCFGLSIGFDSEIDVRGHLSLLIY